MSDIAGTKGFSDFTDTVLWMQAHGGNEMLFYSTDNYGAEIKTPAFPDPRVKKWCNRTIHIMKQRHNRKLGNKIGVFMNGGNLLHTECGWIDSAEAVKEEK